MFITQNEEDHLLLNLTVEEVRQRARCDSCNSYSLAQQAIRFASKVKNSARSHSCRCVQKCADISSDLVASLIDQLDLERCRHTLVGKCSGGQKKRLAIAQELASHEKPKIIFMDEPTSGESITSHHITPLQCSSLTSQPHLNFSPGIDSSVSYLVLKQLQELTQRHGIAIVATIHQPSYKILELFDQLYILSRRGKAIYQGTGYRVRNAINADRCAFQVDRNTCDNTCCDTRFRVRTAIIQPTW